MTITENIGGTGGNEALYSTSADGLHVLRNEELSSCILNEREGSKLVCHQEREQKVEEVNDEIKKKEIITNDATVTVADNAGQTTHDEKSNREINVNDADHIIIAQYVSSKWLSAVHNKNVFRVLLFCAIDGAAYSIWNQQVFQVLIHQLAGDTAVGWMSAVSGVSQMLTAVIAGVFGDKWKREWILRTGAVAGFIAVMMTFLGIAKLQMPILYAAQVMWGAYSGIGATGTEAIFADSVATGRRAFVYNLKWMDETLSSIVGIITTLVLLVKMGNEWKQSSMMTTMFVGLGVHPIAMLTLWTLRDKFALHEGSPRYIDREEEERELEEQQHERIKENTVEVGNSNSEMKKRESEGAKQKNNLNKIAIKSTKNYNKSDGLVNHSSERENNMIQQQQHQQPRCHAKHHEHKTHRAMRATDVVVMGASAKDQMLLEHSVEERYIEDKRCTCSKHSECKRNGGADNCDNSGHQDNSREEEEEEELCDLANSTLVDSTRSVRDHDNINSTQERNKNQTIKEEGCNATAIDTTNKAGSVDLINNNNNISIEYDHNGSTNMSSSSSASSSLSSHVQQLPDEMCRSHTSSPPRSLSLVHSPTLPNNTHSVEIIDLDSSNPTELVSCEEAAKRVSMQLDAQDRLAWREYRAKRSAMSNPLLKIWLTFVFALHLPFSHDAVPFLVCLVDFLVAFGSGMTLRYLLLYFVEDYHTTPSVLMTATLITCPVQALFAYMVQHLGDYYLGRILSTIVVRVTGAVLLLVMGFTHFPLWLLLPIYIVRNALMNSVRGVTRSVIMDSVKKENRAKWSAFESFSSFTWAGSAMVGGYIAEAKGYQFSFNITAYVHFFALFILSFAIAGSLPVERALMRAKHINRKVRAARSKK